MSSLDDRAKLEELEIQLLLQGVYQRYGFDFREYSPESLKRRILDRARKEKQRTVLGLLDEVLRNADCMERLLLDLSINVTAMFRDPSFYQVIREKAVPILRTYPFIRVWVAGCASGEELYSIAILMREEGLYDRCRLYATDMNEVVLQKAKNGVYPLAVMKDYTDNYIKAGGTESFSEYYTAKYDNAILLPSLRNNVVFSQHNLVTDGSFNEFNLVLCRNVMIYFGKSLQERVHRLLYESLCTFGILGLGNKESLRFSPLHESDYQELDRENRLYRRAS